MPRTNNQAYFGSATDVPGSGTEEEEEDSDDDLSLVHPDSPPPPISAPILTPPPKTQPKIESLAATLNSLSLATDENMPVSVEFDILRNQPDPLIPDAVRSILACCFIFSGGFDLNSAVPKFDINDPTNIKLHITEIKNKMIARQRMRHLLTNTEFAKEYVLTMQKRLDETYSLPGARERIFTLALPSGLTILPGFIDRHTHMPAIDPIILTQTKPSKKNQLLLPEYYGFTFLLLADDQKINKARMAPRNRTLNGVSSPLFERSTRIRTLEEISAGGAGGGEVGVEAEVSDDSDEDDDEDMNI